MAITIIKGGKLAKVFKRKAGKPFKLPLEQAYDMYLRHGKGERIAALAVAYNVSPATVYNTLKRIEAMKEEGQAQQEVA